MSIFLTMLELHLAGLKSILFYPEDQKMFVSNFLCSKEQIRKRSIFYEIPWTNPFANCRFFATFLEVHLSSLKSVLFYPEYQKIFLYGFFCSKKKNIWEKRSIFWQKPCTNPLQNVDFFYFARISLFGSKKHSLLSRIKKMFLSGFFG